MSRIAKLAAASSMLFVVMSCANQLRSRPIAVDPSNAAAEEGAELTVPRALSSPPESAPKAPSVVDAGVTAYRCPMHPEVVQQTPGTCPKCGMQLVPDAPAPQAEPAAEGMQHQHHQHHGHHGHHSADGGMR